MDMGLLFINALKLRNMFAVFKKEKGRVREVTSPDKRCSSRLICQRASASAHVTAQTILITGPLVMLFFTFFHEAGTVKL